MRVKIKYEIGFIVLLISIFILVIISGLLLNQKISTTVDRISVQIQPDDRLLLMKAVYNDLIEAENSIYSYKLTKNRTHLIDFYSVVIDTEKKVNKLKNYSSNDKFYRLCIDSLEQLVDQKYSIVDSMLLIQNQYRVNEAMNMVEEKVSEVDESSTSVIPVPNSNEGKKIRAYFNKLNRKNKSSDGVYTEGSKLKIFARELNKLKEDEVNKELVNNQNELQLTQRNKEIMAKIASFLTRLELSERTNIASRTKEARKSATDAKFIVEVFSILATILLIITSYAIVKYIKRNNEYRTMLKKAKQESEDLAASKARFLSNMSHEIRTPLNSIIGFSEQLSQTEYPFNDNEQRKHIEIIKKSAQHLLNIINDILDFTKLEANKVKLEVLNFNILDEVEDVFQALDQAAVSRGNKIELEQVSTLPPAVQGDPIKFRQILINLLGNAIKFTENGTISVRLQTKEIEAGLILLELEVSDTGIGIASEQMYKIFDEFEQESSATERNYGGSGLGLSITKMLVELQQGSISVSSQKGKGSRFTVCLPYKIGSTKAPELSQKKIDLSVVLGGKRVLVVDDEPYNRKLLHIMLEKYGVDFIEAENGMQALELINENQFDLILVDLHMPKMDGKELSEKIRNHKSLRKRKTKIIAITAGLPEELENQLVFMDGILIKPFTEEEFHLLIQNLFDKKNGVKSGPENEQLMEKKQSKKLYKLDSLRHLSNGNDNFIKDLIETIIRTTEQGVSELENFYQKGNYKGMSETAHRISAPCKHLSIDVLYQYLKKIEYEATNGMTKSDLLECLEQVKSESKKVIESLKKEKF